MSELFEKQKIFARMMVVFKAWILSHPQWTITGGELFRPPVMAAYYAAKGTGILKSKHCDRLAEDINLFINGVYQEDTEAHRPLGEKWKSMHPLNRWGGDNHDSEGNPDPDGNHYQHG